MTGQKYDVIVLGVGGMGSATLYNLSKRNLHVCGVEQFSTAHDRGSSHGRTRIIRRAYFEHPDYLPLLERAYLLWEELQHATVEELLVPCEMIVAGAPGGSIIKGLEAAYNKYSVPHERLSAAAARQRFPQFRLPDDFVVYVDPTAGFLHVEKCVEQHVHLARQNGAEVFENEKVLRWSADSRGVSVRTERRNLQADKLIITAGAWAHRELALLKLDLKIWRKLTFWYDSPAISNFSFGKFPIFYVELDYGDFYGFPAIDDLGLKVAEHVQADLVDEPEQLDRALGQKDEDLTWRFVNDVFPGLQPRRTRYSVCMYTKTPDEHFVLDLHPEFPNVVLGCGFSGHGFKFASVVGEILSELALEGATPSPVEFLRLRRFKS